MTERIGPSKAAHLDEMIERARRHRMTPEERRAQRRSWVIGQMALSHPEMTIEEIERVVDGVIDG